MSQCDKCRDAGYRSEHVPDTRMHGGLWQWIHVYCDCEAGYLAEYKETGREPRGRERDKEAPGL